MENQVKQKANITKLIMAMRKNKPKILKLCLGTTKKYREARQESDGWCRARQRALPSILRQQHSTHTHTMALHAADSCTLTAQGGGDLTD